MPFARRRPETGEYEALCEPLGLDDVAAVAAAMLSIALLLGLRVVGVGDLVYIPYPEVAAPGFEGAAAFAIVLLLFPAFVGTTSKTSEPIG